ncbi:unnamed protein product, partial [Symbiodinium sp. CCMP2456]
LIPKLTELDETLKDKKRNGLFKKEVLTEFGKIKSGSKQDLHRSLCTAMLRLHDAFSVPPSQRFGPLAEVVAECGNGLDTAPGYALRIESLAVLALARDFQLFPGSDGRRRRFDAIWRGFGACRKRLRAMRIDKRATARTHAEKLRKEWLLAEQPLGHKFLLLTDCQPQSGADPRKVTGKDLRTLALHWSHVLEASLCWVCLEVCQALATSMLPCWSLATSHSCRAKDCPYAHDKQDPMLLHLVASRMLEVANEGSKVLKSKDLQTAFSMLGTMAMEALGGPELWKKRSELPERSIHFLITRLKALVPESPSRALDAQLSQEEVALFSEEASRNQLKAIEARRRPPDLHEVVSVLSLLPFTGSNRRKLEMQLLKLAQMDKQASNPVFLLANTIVAGFAKKTEDGKIRAFDFFLADLKVMQQLWTFWKDTKGRLRNFYSIPPCSVFYLLERVVVWASVLLTQFSNTLLPQSYLHAHFTGAEELLQEVASAGAKVAAEWRPTALNALKHVVEFVVAFLYWDHSLYEWLDKTKASYGESVLRLYVLVLAASANDEEARKFAFEHWNTKLKLDKKLDIFRKVREKEGADLPTAMQRLMCFHTRKEPWLTWVMPWQNDILTKLGDPYVRLFRQGTKHTRLTRTLDKYEPFQMPRLRANDTEKVKKRDGQSSLLLPLPYIGFHRMRKFRVVTKEGMYKDISIFSGKAGAQAEARAQEPEDAEEEAEGAAEELSTPAVTAPEAEEAVPEADTAEGEPAKAESKAEAELSNILANTTAPRLDDDLKLEAAKVRREKSLFERAYKAWRSWKEEKDKSKRAREEQRRKRQQLVEQGEEDEVEDRDTWETEELRLRSTAAELCAELLGGEAKGTPKVLVEELEKWFEHCLRMMKGHRQRWNRQVRETFEEHSESLNERFDALLGELAGEHDFTICCAELGHDVMQSLGKASMCQKDTLTCQLRVHAAIGLCELLAEACRDEGTEVKPVIQWLHYVLATPNFELPAERKRPVLSDADQAVPDMNPAAPAQEPSLAEDDEEKPERDPAEEVPVPETEEEADLAAAPAMEEKPSPTAAVVEEAPIECLPTHEKVTIETKTNGEEEPIDSLPAHEKETDPLMGVAIEKKINGEVFRGKVEDIEVGQVSRDRLYRIRYTDGDLEHMEQHEVRSLLLLHAGSVTALAGARDQAAEPQAALHEEKEKQSTEEVADDSADAVETSSKRQRVEEPKSLEEKTKEKEPSDQTMTEEPEDGNENGIYNVISSSATKIMEVFLGRPETPVPCTEVPHEEEVKGGAEQTEAKEPLEKDSEILPAPAATPSTPTGPSRTAPAPASASPEAKRKSKASKHAAKRQQKREEKEVPSAAPSLKDELPEWYEQETELRAKVLDCCKLTLESAGNIKEGKQVVEKKKGPGWQLEQLIRDLRTWCDHCEERQERDSARWNRQINKAYDKESDQIYFLGEQLADEPRSSLDKSWPVTDLLDRAKKPQRFNSVLLRSHLDVETVGVFIQVLQEWQRRCEILATPPKEALALLSPEQAEKLKEVPPAFVANLKEYIKLASEVVGRVSWAVAVEEPALAEANTAEQPNEEVVEDVRADQSEPEEEEPASQAKDIGGVEPTQVQSASPPRAVNPDEPTPCQQCQEMVPKNRMK